MLLEVRPFRVEFLMMHAPGGILSNSHQSVESYVRSRLVAYCTLTGKFCEEQTGNAWEKLGKSPF